MSRLEDHIIRTIKPILEKGDLEGLKELWKEYHEGTEFPREIAWDYVFQKVYLHSALKKQHAICQWLDDIFLQFDPIVQIAMRQMFAYSRVLLHR